MTITKPDLDSIRSVGEINKSITRRDFLNGVAIGAGGLMLQACGSDKRPSAIVTTQAPVQFSPPGIDEYYPPTLTGMRGNHPGSFDVAHPLAWSNERPAQEAADTGEEYDLVVVGGGISGLAAACFFQLQHGKGKRILILDNHDDFGGHAKRNEFEAGGRMLLGIGGAVNLESPELYSKVVKDLLDTVGLDLKKLEDGMESSLYLSSMNEVTGMYLEDDDGVGQAIVGRWLHAFRGVGDYASLINQLSLPESERQKIIELASGKIDYLQGLSDGARVQYLASHSYHQFLSEKVGLDQGSVTLFEALTRLLTGVGGDGISVEEAFGYGAPGVRSVSPQGSLPDAFFDPTVAPYRALLFPDGDSSVARLMVRYLIPAVSPGKQNGIDDLVGARFDYSQLDLPDTPVRLRLNSTATRARQVGDKVVVSYVEKGQSKCVSARHSILACFNAIIPRLCAELPEAQQEALRYGVKLPFLWANVVLRDGAPFYAAGAEFFECPRSYFSVVTKAPATTFKDFQPPQGPGEPLVVFMMRSPTPAKQLGMSARDLYRQARRDMLATPFATYEQEIRRQLMAMFGSKGFVADRDIEAITVNRWGHGYAYKYLQLDDGPFAEGAYPHEIGRKQFGRISIANSDAEARPTLDSAIEAAWRAVSEQSQTQG